MTQLSDTVTMLRAERLENNNGCTMLSDHTRLIEEHLRQVDDLVNDADLTTEDDRHCIENHLNRTAAAVRCIPMPNPEYRSIH